MLHAVRTAFSDVLGSFLFRTPPVLQYAALCHRDTPKGREVLMITSSHGRWILPKGWPIDGLSAGETAAQEAWEEAGVKAAAVSEALGTFETIKRFNDGQEVPCETTVFAVEVADIKDDFPEAQKRERRWLPQQEAARTVEEDGLREIIASF